MQSIKHVSLSIISAAVLLFTSVVSASEKITHYHFDALGSPVAATDAQGTVIWRETYQPYGERIQKQPTSSSNARWYTGHVEDQETGLSYAGARYYDSSIGRFMATDPKAFAENNPVTFNRYTYANNNPYVYVDPDGKASKIASLIRLTSKGFKEVARLTKEEAMIARRQGENILADRRQVGKQIEVGAHGDQDLIRHKGHDLGDGASGMSHYQTEGKTGHTFWGKASVAVGSVAGTVASALDNWAEAAEAIDPVPKLQSSAPGEIPGYRQSWFGGWQKVDPNAPEWNEVLKQHSAK